jgi:hypothetical protein
VIDPTDHLSETTKHVVDAVSLLTVVGTLASWLPSIAALFTILWTIIRIAETDTVKGWTGRSKS